MEIPTPGAQIFRFGVFELDGTSGELRRHGLKIRLPDQSFQILKVLANRAGEVVTREELRQVLWTPDTFVDFEVGLNSAVRKLREALGDSAENPRFVETLPRRGYRFVASVTSPAADAPVTGAAAEPARDTSRARPTSTVGKPVLVTVPAIAPTPRRRLLTRAAVGMLLVVCALGAAVLVVFQPGSFTATPDAEPIRSILVLPFENLTGDAGQDSFVDHVSDAVTAHLARINGLDVISRTTARQYARTSKRLPEIGKELRVDGVLEGTVVRSATGVRITAKLIRAATDRHVWVQDYQDDVGQMLRLQERIASDIAVAAGRPPPRRSRRGPAQSVNPQAYDAYVKGLTARGIQRHEGFRRAVTYFEEAVAIQPDFAGAHASLALTQLQFLFGGPFSPHETIPKAEAAARTALQLDDTMAEAHRALGQVLTLYYWRWDEGAKVLQRSAELEGRELSEAVTEPLIRQRRFAEALTAAEHARRLDPLSLNAQMLVGSAYHAAGQYDRAADEFRKALQISPGSSRVLFQLGITSVAQGRLDDAIRELEAASRPVQGHNSRMEAYLGYAYAAAGRVQDARRVLTELESHRRDQYVSWFGIALIHDALGEKEPALAALERAYEDHAVEFAQTHYPPFSSIASEPRYQAVMRQVGLRP